MIPSLIVFGGYDYKIGVQLNISMILAGHYVMLDTGRWILDKEGVFALSLKTGSLPSIQYQVSSVA